MRARLQLVFALVLAAIGLDEVLIVGALALITVAIWPLAGRLALAVPGLVILYLALPTRDPFVTRGPSAPPTARRKR